MQRWVPRYDAKARVHGVNRRPIEPQSLEPLNTGFLRKFILMVYHVAASNVVHAFTRRSGVVITPLRDDGDRRRDSRERYKPQVKLSVNVSAEQGERVRTIAFEQRVSESSIVQVALQLLFVRGNDALVGALLREKGATLRRK
jgi:hypothetical protein